MAPPGKIHVLDDGKLDGHVSFYKTYGTDPLKPKDIPFNGFLGMGNYQLEVGTDETLVLQSHVPTDGGIRIHRTNPNSGFKLVLPDYLASKVSGVSISHVDFDEKTHKVKYQISFAGGKNTPDVAKFVVEDDFGDNLAAYNAAKTGKLNIIDNVSVIGAPRDEHGAIKRDDFGIITASNDSISYADLNKHQEEVKRLTARYDADKLKINAEATHNLELTRPIRSIKDYQDLASKGLAPEIDPEYAPYWHEILSVPAKRESLTKKQDLQVSAAVTEQKTSNTKYETKFVNGMFVQVPVAMDASAAEEQTPTSPPSAQTPAPQAPAAAQSTFTAPTLAASDNRAFVTEFVDGKSKTTNSGEVLSGVVDGKMKTNELRAAILQLSEALPQDEYHNRIQSLYNRAFDKNRMSETDLADMAALIKLADNRKEILGFTDSNHDGTMGPNKLNVGINKLETLLPEYKDQLELLRANLGKAGPMSEADAAILAGLVKLAKEKEPDAQGQGPTASAYEYRKDGVYQDGHLVKDARYSEWQEKLLEFKKTQHDGTKPKGLGTKLEDAIPGEVTYATAREVIKTIPDAAKRDEMLIALVEKGPDAFIGSGKYAADFDALMKPDGIAMVSAREQGKEYERTLLAQQERRQKEARENTGVAKSDHPLNGHGNKVASAASPANSAEVFPIDPPSEATSSLTPKPDVAKSAVTLSDAMRKQQDEWSTLGITALNAPKLEAANGKASLTEAVQGLPKGQIADVAMADVSSKRSTAATQEKLVEKITPQTGVSA